MSTEQKPWERYAAAAPAAPKTVPGPWNKYRAQTPAVVDPGEKSAVKDLGQSLMEIPRQVGLTARYGLEGLGQAANIITEPIRATINPALRAVGLPEATQSAGELGTTIADLMRLPQPKNSTERVVGDAARLMATGGGIAGVAGKLAQTTGGLTQTAMQGLAANPLQQVASAGGSGLAGGSVREAGGSELEQGIAAVIGGVGAGLVAQAIANTAPKIMAQVSPKHVKSVENQIEFVLKQQGVDWSDVPVKIRQDMQKEVERALKSGENLSPDAMRRMLDFKRVGATPTRGTLTLDPVQITKEQNLARTGANSADDGLQGLARIRNQNNRTLIDNLNQLGANTTEDAYAAGNRAMQALERGIDAEKSNIGRLYDAARDSAGRSVSLDRPAFAQRVNDALDQAMVGGALPGDVRNHLNRIATGEVPFDINYAEQLKTRIGQLQRSSNDGQIRYALGLVRQALDDTPLVGSGQQAGIGADALNAFNQARGANRSMMQRIEGSPALKSLYDGNATPDDFVQKFIIGSGAKADNVRDLAREIASTDPAAMDAVRGNIAQYLKSKAIGAGTADEVGNFSASGFRRALDAIGDRKLSAFFTKQEVAQLKAISNVANYTSAQPVGSAVNNSNSGALLLGRGVDMLDNLSAKVPLLGIGPTIQGVIKTNQQGAAQNIAPALVNRAASQQASTVVRPALTFGSLFAVSPTVNGRQDD